MASKYSPFSYKPGNSFLHKTPAWIKLILIFVLNILIFALPPVVALVFLVLQFILCCCLKFTLKEQFCDLKPVLYYAFLLYIFNIFAGLITLLTAEETYSAMEIVKKLFTETLLNKETFFMLAKLFCIMQSASIIYKTSTSLEIREGIGSMERAIRKVFHLKEKLVFTNTLSLFINFIPMVFSVWTQIKQAWHARQGKNNLKMYMTLLPVLFSVGMKRAYNSAKAIAIRQ